MLIDSNMIILFYSVMSDMDDYKYHRNKIPMFGFHEHLGRHMITIFKYQLCITIWFFDVIAYDKGSLYRIPIK